MDCNTRTWILEPVQRAIWLLAEHVAVPTAEGRWRRIMSALIEVVSEQHLVDHASAVVNGSQWTNMYIYNYIYGYYQIASHQILKSPTRWPGTVAQAKVEGTLSKQALHISKLNLQSPYIFFLIIFYLKRRSLLASLTGHLICETSHSIDENNNS